MYDEEVICHGGFQNAISHYAICGEGLCIGYDSGDAVSKITSQSLHFPEEGSSKVIYDMPMIYNNGREWQW
jgi:arylsulfatase